MSAPGEVRGEREPRRATTDEKIEPRPDEPPAERHTLGEPLAMFAIATGLCAVLWQLKGPVPFIGRNLHALIAAVFLYLPTGLLLRRREDFARYGLTARPLGRGVAMFIAASAIAFPLFALGMYGYYAVVCSLRSALVPAGVRTLCARFVGSWRRARWRMPKSFGELVLAQLLVVALPEEYFFRGYLQTRLEARWPSRRRLLGAAVGRALVVTSALFALGHLLVDGNGLRLAVFFPALLFGWLRNATGSILAGVLFHAASNLVSEVLHGFFF
jgi:membrane protease YdiL (CAAX protease family)